MFNKFGKFSLSFIPGFRATSSFDKVGSDTETGEHLLSKATNLEITGWERLKYSFSVSKYGESTPELLTVTNSGLISTFCGAIYGGVRASREKAQQIMANSDADKFFNARDAQKKLHDRIHIDFAKGAWKYGWRIGLFTSCYVFGSTALSVYRNEFGVLDCTVGGILAGTLFKMSMGFRGMVVGAGAGAALGTAAGTLTLLMQKLSGIDIQETRSINYLMRRQREDLHRRNEVITRMGELPHDVHQLYNLKKDLSLGIDDLKIENSEQSENKSTKKINK